MARKMSAVFVMVLASGFGQAGYNGIVEGRLSPRLLNYQGYLTDTLGNPITNPSLSMTFAIFDVSSAGNQKWTETQSSIGVDRGIFHVLLGSVTPIPDSVFLNGTDRWLELTVAGQTLTPRTRIVSAPFAYAATYSDTSLYARNAAADNDWTHRITDTADTTLQTGGQWGIARAGSVLYGNADSTHVNFGVACTTGYNYLNRKYCTVSGGLSNTASGDYATVAGGRSNSANYPYSAVGGGYADTAIGNYSAVGGGYHNRTGDSYATVAGGRLNAASSYAASVGGGTNNTASGDNSTVGGGSNNTATGSEASIAGGYINTASGMFSTVGGGYRNNNAGNYATITGGYRDTIASGADFSYLFGIGSNLTQDSTFMVDMPHVWFGTEAAGYEFPNQRGTDGQVMITDGSGQLNWSGVPADNDWTYRITDTADTTLQMGGRWGLARPGTYMYGNADSTHVNLGTISWTGTPGQNYKYCTVGGGSNNTASAANSTVSGGVSNEANGSYTSVGGGDCNIASNYYATVAGGHAGSAIAYAATVGGGLDNTANGYAATVAGGSHNTASYGRATVGGGENNAVNADYSTIAGGYADTITSTGDYSYLFGINSNLTQDSTFMVDLPHVWFGTEAAGYEFPKQRGTNGQVMVTNGNGQLSWNSVPTDNDWVFRVTDTADTTLQTGGCWGIARLGNVLYGNADSTHVNLGVACTTGASGQNHKYATVGGGNNNVSSDWCTTVAGGWINKAVWGFATIGGGENNLARGWCTTIAGGCDNNAANDASTIGGGRSNQAEGHYAAVGGGRYSRAGDAAVDTAAVCAGYNNSALAKFAFIGGGQNNTANGAWATISGGCNNSALYGAAVGGGYYNSASNQYAAIGGGCYNTANDYGSTVGGGESNATTGMYSTVGGGYDNTAEGRATVGGGYGNTASGVDATVAGGAGNNAGELSIVGGGSYNSAIGYATTIAGGWCNAANNDYAAVGGGYADTASGAYATIGGGYRNKANGIYATIGGGYADTASGNWAIVGGGIGNSANGPASTIGGGEQNIASGDYATVSGGYRNTAGSMYSTVSGGWSNYADSTGAIAGGYGDTVIGQYGFAVNYSTCVLSGHSSSAAFTSSHTTASNQVRAMAFSTGTMDFAMDHPDDPMNKILNQYAIGSDEVMLKYRGSAVVGADGRVVVNLPDYFDDINRNPMVQLTGVGTYEVFIAEDIIGNRFVIGGKPNTKVYWEVTGERKDIHAEITRIQTPVVQEKTGDLRNHSIDDDAMIGIYDDIKPKNPELFVFKTAEGRRVHEQAKEIAGSK